MPVGAYVWVTRVLSVFRETTPALLLTRPTAMNTLRPVALVATAALVAGLSPALASAGSLMQRPNRVTANPVTTTNQVLVAVPTERLSEYDYLYVATAADLDTHGVPFAVDGATPDNSTLVLMNAPLLDARNGGFGENFLRAQPSGFQTFSLGSAAPEGNRKLGEEVAAARDALAKPVAVFASKGPRLAELPARLQRDPWALLNAGRLHDAGSVFAAMPAAPARDAGMALAAALLGNVDAAGDALGAIEPSALPMTLPMSAGTAARARGLATDLYPGTPAAAVLNALADRVAVMPMGDLPK